MYLECLNNVYWNNSFWISWAKTFNLLKWKWTAGNNCLVIPWVRKIMYLPLFLQGSEKVFSFHVPGMSTVKKRIPCVYEVKKNLCITTARMPGFFQAWYSIPDTHQGNLLIIVSLEPTKCTGGITGVIWQIGLLSLHVSESIQRVADTILNCRSK